MFFLCCCFFYDAIAIRMFIFMLKGWLRCVINGSVFLEAKLRFVGFVYVLAFACVWNSWRAWVSNCKFNLEREWFECWAVFPPSLHAIRAETRLTVYRAPQVRKIRLHFRCNLPRRLFYKVLPFEFVCKLRLYKP